jgi:hypothetical protein
MKKEISHSEMLEMITALNSRMDTLVNKEDFQRFQDEVKPYLQGMAGLGILWKLLIALGSLLAAYATFQRYIKGA